jgi:hypothetical protein
VGRGDKDLSLGCRGPVTFGRSVAIDGDYAIVGADRTTTRVPSSGSAYIFRRTGTNTWDAGTKILASDAAASDWFGYSVGISGDYAIVGAHLNDDGGSTPALPIFLCVFNGDTTSHVCLMTKTRRVMCV